MATCWKRFGGSASAAEHHIDVGQSTTPVAAIRSMRARRVNHRAITPRTAHGGVGELDARTDSAGGAVRSAWRKADHLANAESGLDNADSRRASAEARRIKIMLRVTTITQGTIPTSCWRTVMCWSVLQSWRMSVRIGRMVRYPTKTSERVTKCERFGPARPASGAEGMTRPRCSQHLLVRHYAIATHWWHRAAGRQTGVSTPAQGRPCTHTPVRGDNTSDFRWARAGAHRVRNPRSSKRATAVAIGADAYRRFMHRGGKRASSSSG